MVFLSGWTSGRQEPCEEPKDSFRGGTGMVAFHVDLPVSPTRRSGWNLSSGLPLAPSSGEIHLNLTRRRQRFAAKHCRPTVKKSNSPANQGFAQEPSVRDCFPTA